MVAITDGAMCRCWTLDIYYSSYCMVGDDDFCVHHRGCIIGVGTRYGHPGMMLLAAWERCFFTISPKRTMRNCFYAPRREISLSRSRGACGFTVVIRPPFF